MDQQARTLGAVVGARLRDLRVDAGRSQDALAAAARSLSLEWTRGSVASLETGRRGLSAEELLLLPAVLAELIGGKWEIADLIPRDERVMLAASFEASGHHVRQSLRGNYRLDQVAATVERAQSGGADPQAPVQVAPLNIGPEAARELYRQLSGAPLDVAADAKSEAARHAAARLSESGVSDRVDAETVTAIAYRLWGRGITAERDLRAEGRASRDATPRSMQAIRNHVTRELLEELRAALKEDHDG